jgi:hypothetical protein
MVKQRGMDLKYMKTIMNTMALGKKTKDTEKDSLRMQVLEKFVEYYVKMILKSKS